MKILGIYELATGKITSIRACSSYLNPVPEGLLPSTGITKLPTKEHIYWVDVANKHEVFPKTHLPFSLNKLTIEADSTDEALITGLPNPVTVTWPDGQVDVVTDNEVGLKTDQIGTHIIKIESIPHLTEEIVIEAITPT